MSYRRDFGQSSSSSGGRRSAGDVHREIRREMLLESSDDEDERMIRRMEDDEVELRAFSSIILNQRAPRNRRYTRRDRRTGGIRLFNDYFSENPTFNSDVFRRRFRMQRSLFLRILHAVEGHDEFFQQKTQCTGEMGLTPYQKVTAAVRMLANGCSADSVDEYIRIGETTTYLCLQRFCEAVIQIFGRQYLREPTAADMARLLQQNKARGFPGMIGSLDCMHWDWKNCPKAWAGSYSGYKKHPTIILEAVASQDLWFWHVFFGMPGSYNDINVLNRSDLFDQMMKGRSPPVQYEVNGRTYDMPYYLGDGIYPKLATIVKTIPVPRTQKESNFAKAQESIRKDVERAFGVFQARWAIIRQPARTWKTELMHSIMVACVVLHNMIVEDEPHLPRDYVYDNTGETEPPVREHRNRVGRYQHMLEQYARIHDQAAHNRLRADLIDHLWNEAGHLGD